MMMIPPSHPDGDGAANVQENCICGSYAWWRVKQDRLISLIREHQLAVNNRKPNPSPAADTDTTMPPLPSLSPALFVYDEDFIRQNAQTLLHQVSSEDRAVDRVFFALKSNSHPRLLQLFFELGLGFECVSIEEVRHVLHHLPSIERSKILFTPNFADRSEYEEGFLHGVNVTLDNVFPLLAWPQTFRGKDIFVRVDPGRGAGHHKKVQTAGIHSKFGVPVSEFETLKRATFELDINVVGLHSHLGSGIFSPDAWADAAIIVSQLISPRMFPDVRVIDLGGGFGVPYRPEEPRLDLEAVMSRIRAFRHDLTERTGSNREIWIEPGRFLVAEGGVLLATVTQTKQKGDHAYVGINTGMNALIRPALYGSYHEIVNLSRVGEPCVWQNVDIVGPICESGDILGEARVMPKCESGDVILIATTGAYGRSMSSFYNLRAPPMEVFL